MTLLKRASIALLILALGGQTALADFSDVKKAHPNYTAIEYLQSTGTLQGYEDGSFRPQNSVNRAEFLKIIIEGSNIPTDINNETPFKDVNHDSWYGPYLKKAFHSGWIEGYSDGTFRPEQTINKVEAIKITAKAQNWPITVLNQQPFTDTPADAWYTPYIIFAKNNGLLEDTSDTFNPGENMTRAKISEIIYRTIINEISTIENPEIIIEEPSEEEPQITTPINGGTISKTFFDNITLNENLPDTFYKNEIYIVSGKSQTNSEKITLILESNGEKENISKTTENGNFSIPLTFSQSGTYQIGLLNGSSGSTKAQEITVQNSIPENLTANKPDKSSNLAISFNNDQPLINFDADDSTLKKITFNQGNKQVTLYNRQNTSEIVLNYSSFANFSETQTNFKIDLATAQVGNTITRTSDFTTGDSKSFSATNHEFTIIESAETNATPPETLSSASKNITFSAKTFVDINTRGFVITPDGEIETITVSSNSPKSTYYSSEIILANGTFSFDYNPSENGTYIIEINNKNGQAIINHPVYIGGAIPLIPNYFDLNDRKFFSGTLNLNSARNELLNLINSARTEYNLNPVSLDSELNSLAQAHSQDMVDRDFFAHINPDGDSSNDRRIAAGIDTPVGENIAVDTSIITGHLALMRSAAHLNNIIEPSWTRVGIGIVAANGYLTISEEFSGANITESDLQNFESELLEAINDTRSNANIPELATTAQLTSASQSLNQKIENGETLDNTLFTTTLEENNVSGASQAIIRTYNAWQEIIDSILEDELDTITENTWERVGIDVSKSASGILYSTLILNNP